MDIDSLDDLQAAEKLIGWVLCSESGSTPFCWA